ncbi:MAG: metallophosphoesterase [Flavobacteriaceae bacterium]|nr:metallophosphoesterase [Flavobacteriaceae bacterium]
MYKLYKQLREEGYTHKKVSGMINKSKRQKYRYLSDYNEEKGITKESKQKTVIYNNRLEYQYKPQYKYSWQVDPNTIPDSEKIVLFITDEHLPFSKEEWLEWVVQIAIKYGVNVIVHGGDLTDQHANSFHDNEPDALGAEAEFELAYDMVQKRARVFPYVYFCESNHDKIPERKAAKMGLSSRYLKSFNELFNLPDTWIMKSYHIVNGVRYEHGHKSKGGVHGAFNTAINNRMSTCVGHYHGNFGIKYQNNGNSKIFGLAGGTLMDNEAYAFRYGEGAANKPIVGVSIIYNDQFAITIPYNK